MNFLNFFPQQAKRLGKTLLNQSHPETDEKQSFLPALHFKGLHARIDRLIPPTWKEMQVRDPRSGFEISVPVTRAIAIECIGEQFLFRCELATFNDLWTSGGESGNLVFSGISAASRFAYSAARSLLVKATTERRSS